MYLLTQELEKNLEFNIGVIVCLPRLRKIPRKEFIKEITLNNMSHFNWSKFKAHQLVFIQEILTTHPKIDDNKN